MRQDLAILLTAEREGSGTHAPRISARQTKTNEESCIESMESLNAAMGDNKSLEQLDVCFARGSKRAETGGATIAVAVEIRTPADGQVVKRREPSVMRLRRGIVPGVIDLKRCEASLSQTRNEMISIRLSRVSDC